MNLKKKQRQQLQEQQHRTFKGHFPDADESTVGTDENSIVSTFSASASHPQEVFISRLQM